MLRLSQCWRNLLNRATLDNTENLDWGSHRRWACRFSYNIPTNSESIRALSGFDFFCTLLSPESPWMQQRFQIMKYSFSFGKPSMYLPSEKIKGLRINVNFPKQSFSEVPPQRCMSNLAKYFSLRRREFCWQFPISMGCRVSPPTRKRIEVQRLGVEYTGELDETEGEIDISECQPSGKTVAFKTRMLTFKIVNGTLPMFWAYPRISGPRNLVRG